MTAPAPLPPQHSPGRMLPCPTAIYSRALWGNLKFARPGDVGAILFALRETARDIGFTLSRLEGPDDGLERDALIHLGLVLDEVRRHVVALWDRSTPIYVPKPKEEIPS